MCRHSYCYDVCEMTRFFCFVFFFTPDVVVVIVFVRKYFVLRFLFFFERELSNTSINDDETITFSGWPIHSRRCETSTLRKRQKLLIIQFAGVVWVSKNSDIYSSDLKMIICMSAVNVSAATSCSFSRGSCSSDWQ